MAGSYLTTASTITCPHGGQVMLTTGNGHVYADGSPVLLETDVHQVTGCPFMIGQKYSPCVKVEWSAGAGKSAAGGTPALVASSTGKCTNAEGATQGMAIVACTQGKVSSR